MADILPHPESLAGARLPTSAAADTPIYSPASIINILANTISVPGTNRIIALRGVYQAKGRELYGGFYYDQLKDEASDFSITLVVPAIIRNQLTNNKTIEVICYITRRATKDGSVILQANVTDLVNQTQNKYTEEEIRTLEIQQLKSEKGFRDLDSFIKTCIFEDRKPNVTIILGRSAVIQHDIIGQMSEAVSLYNINFLQTTINSVPDIITAIQSVNNSETDVIVIARGGGDQEIETFNKPELAEACLDLQPFLVTALGHKVNTPLLDRIADRRFITPTAFGQYLKDIYNTTVEELAQSKAKLVDDITKQLKTVYDKEVQNLTSQVTASQTAYNALLKEKESNTRLLETANQLARQYQESYRSLQSSTTIRIIIIAILAILAGLVIGYLL